MAVLALSACAFVAAGTSAALLAGGEPVDVSASTQLRQCLTAQPVTVDLGSADAVNQQEVRSAVSDCIGPVMEGLVLKSGVDAAWDALLQAEASDPLFADCHDSAHYLAHGAARVVPLGNLAAYSRPHCSYGYLDGVAMVIAETNPDWGLAEVAQVVEQSCRSYPASGPDWMGVASNCFHGVGHVLWDWYGPDVGRVFRECASLPDVPLAAFSVSPRAQCVGGATMSIPVNESGTRPDVVPFRAFPGQYCVDLDPESQGQCLAFTYANDISARPGGTDEYLQWCTAPESGVLDPESCFRAVGGRAGFFQDVAYDVAACVSVAGSRAGFARACVEAAIMGLTETGDVSFADAASRVCDEVPDACPLADAVVKSGPSR